MFLGVQHMVRVLRVLVLPILLFPVLSCQFRSQNQAGLTAIVDRESRHALGMLAVRNHIGDLTRFTPTTGGQEYARDLASEMTFYALIECLGTGNITAGQWLSHLERYSFAGELFINSDRKIAFRANAHEALTDRTPCRVVNNKLGTLPVLLKAISAPFEPGRPPTEASYRLAQAFFLSLRGSYNPADPGATASRLAFLPLIALIKSHTGAHDINGEAFVSDLLKLDVDFNPCVQDDSTALLNGQAKVWKRQNYTCVESRTSPNIYDYLPGGNTTYEHVRDMIGHELDAMHEEIFRNQTQLRVDPRVDFFRRLADARSPVGVSDLQHRTFSDRYDLFDLFDRQDTAVQLTEWDRPMLVPVYIGGRLTYIPCAPVIVTWTPGSVNGILNGQVVLPGTVRPAPIQMGQPTGQIIGQPTGQINGQPNGSPISGGRDPVREQLNSPQNNWISGPYLSAADHRLLNESIARGERMPMPEGSPFSRTRVDDVDVYINNNSREWYIFRPGTLIDYGIERRVSVWTNGPHSGTLGANGAMGENYVGVYFRNDTLVPNRAMYGVHSIGHENFEFHQTCRNGSCQTLCDVGNRREFQRLQEHIRDPNLTTEQRQALERISDHIIRATGGCITNRPTGRLALQLDGEDGGDDCTDGGNNGTEPERNTDTTAGQQPIQAPGANGEPPDAGNNSDTNDDNRNIDTTEQNVTTNEELDRAPTLNQNAIIDFQNQTDEIQTTQDDARRLLDSQT